MQRMVRFCKRNQRGTVDFVELVRLSGYPGKLLEKFFKHFFGKNIKERFHCLDGLHGEGTFARCRPLATHAGLVAGLISARNQVDLQRVVRLLMVTIRPWSVFCMSLDKIRSMDIGAFRMPRSLEDDACIDMYFASLYPGPMTRAINCLPLQRSLTYRSS